MKTRICDSLDNKIWLQWKLNSRMKNSSPDSVWRTWEWPLQVGSQACIAQYPVQQPQQRCPEEECKCWENSDGMESSPTNVQPRDFQRTVSCLMFNDFNRLSFCEFALSPVLVFEFMSTFSVHNVWWQKFELFIIFWMKNYLFSSQTTVAKLSSSIAWIQRLFFHLFNLGFVQLSLYPFSAASFWSGRDYLGMLCMEDPSDLQLTPFSLICTSTRCSIPSLRWRTGPLEPVMQVHQEFPAWNQSLLCLLLLL